MNELVAALLLKKYGSGGGGGGYPEPTGTIQITQNGTGIDVKDYAEADVAVENSYTQADEGKVVDNGALVSQTSKNINANGTVDTTKNNEVVVNVPNTYAAGDEGKVVENGALVAQSSQSISANGTYDTTKKNEVVVNVQGAGADEALKKVCEGSLTVLNCSATKVTQARFAKMGSLTEINLPNCTNIGNQAFLMSSGISGQMGNIGSLNLPVVDYIGQQAFEYCDSAISTPWNLELPKCSRIEASAFYGVKNLKTVNCPMTGVSKWSRLLLGSNAFHQCFGLEQFDMRNGSISANCFNQCSSLIALVLRSTTTQSDLSSSDAFSGTPIASGTGYIYVPQALKSTYEAATNWVTYASQFRALEDYTIDGTTTGALDPNKI